MRHHCQRHTARTRMARQDHHRNLEHDAAPGENICERGDCTDSLSSRRCDLREELRGQEGEVSGSIRADVAVCRGAGAAEGMNVENSMRKGRCAASNVAHLRLRIWITYYLRCHGNGLTI